MHLTKYQFAIEETEEGFNVKIAGDKESLRPKLEAFEAYVNYRQKAKAAGLLTHHHRHGHGMLNLMRKHCKEMHK